MQCKGGRTRKLAPHPECAGLFDYYIERQRVWDAAIDAYGDGQESDHRAVPVEPLPDAITATMEAHRQGLAEATHRALDQATWLRGAQLAPAALLIDRFAMLAILHLAAGYAQLVALGRVDWPGPSTKSALLPRRILCLVARGGPCYSRCAEPPVCTVRRAMTPRTHYDIDQFHAQRSLLESCSARRTARIRCQWPRQRRSVHGAGALKFALPAHSGAPARRCASRGWLHLQSPSLAGACPGASACFALAGDPSAGVAGSGAQPPSQEHRCGVVRMARRAAAARAALRHGRVGRGVRYKRSDARAGGVA